MKRLWYITIFYSHIESYKHLYRIHMKTQKRESVFQHRFGCLVTLISPVGNHVCTNPDAVPCHSTQTRLVRQFVFGPFISPRVYKDHVFYRISKFLLGAEAGSSLGIKDSKAPGLLEPAEAILQRAFPLLSALELKALWCPSNLSIFHGLSSDNLTASQNTCWKLKWNIFPRQSFS